MKNFRIFLVLAFAAMLFSLLMGCGEVRQAWKETRKFYDKYLEPAPDVDLSTDSLGSYNDRHLVRLFSPVDSRLQEMLFFFDGSDAEPDSEWLEELFYRFPWINGMLTMDQGGYVYFQYPPDASDGVSVQSILRLDEDDQGGEDAEESVEVAEDDEQAREEDEGAYQKQPWDDRKLRSLVSENRIFSAMPIFTDNIFSGLKVVGYDPRNLLEYCPEPDELIIVGDGQVLWAGNHATAAQALAAMDAEGELDGDTDGSFSADGRTYKWISRYLGELYLIYAAEITDVDAAAPEGDDAS